MYPVKNGRINQVDNVINVNQDKKIQMARKPVNTSDRPGYDFSIEEDDVSYDMGAMNYSSLGF